jgi:hypothetical protein
MSLDIIEASCIVFMAAEEFGIVSCRNTTVLFLKPSIAKPAPRDGVMLFEVEFGEERESENRKLEAE